MAKLVTSISPEVAKELANKIKDWALELGFSACEITSTDLSKYEGSYFNWLDKNFHGSMDYMAKHGTKRTRPTELEPETLSIVSLRLNYLTKSAENALLQLHQPDKAYISRYALGRDYHNLLRQRMRAIVKKIHQFNPKITARVFTDSAPILEKPLAKEAGLGFQGKNSLIIHPRAGSWFFLGEIFLNTPLPTNKNSVKFACGPCSACIDECPTQAIVADGVVDSRRCISYLTIENKNAIPLEFRKAIGNRVYGCDDCQLVCPWNRFTTPTQEEDFAPRNNLDAADLLELFNWTEEEFYQNLLGSPIRRIGYASWIRNLAVGLGNAPPSQKIVTALTAKLGSLNQMVDEHIKWALAEQANSDSYRTPTQAETYAVSPEDIRLLKPFRTKKYHFPYKYF